MSSADSQIPRESPHEGAERTVGRRRSTAYLGERRQSNYSTVKIAHPYVHKESHPDPLHDFNLSGQHERVSDRLLNEQPDTNFKYVGSIEQYGWKPGQIPLFLHWYPEKLDRRSALKFFENGEEYTFGLSRRCDFFFENCEPDCGISAQHLKIKV